MSSDTLLNPAPGMFIHEGWYENAPKLLALINEAAELEYSPTAWTRSRTGVGDHQGANEHRSSVESELGCFAHVDFNDPDFDALQQEMEEFQAALDQLVNNFRRVYDLSLCADEGFRAIRYQNKAEYRIHHDHHAQNSRALSMVLFLNDDFEGGQLEFPHQKVTIEPTAGTVALFPSNFPYAHIAHPVEKGTKYSLVTWFR